MRAQKLAFRDPLDGARWAVLAPALRVTINADLWYFADAASKRRFERDPLRWCGRLTDPVTLDRFVPSPRSPSDRRGDRRWWFESAATRARFVAHPDSFEVTARMLAEAP